MVSHSRNPHLWQNVRVNDHRADAGNVVTAALLPSMKNHMFRAIKPQWLTNHLGVEISSARRNAMIYQDGDPDDVLARPRSYLTRQFFDRFEALARANIDRSMSRLE